MSLNLNQAKVPRHVRFKTTLSMVSAPANSPATSMKPLFRRALYGYEAASAAHTSEDSSSMAHGGHAVGKALGQATKALSAGAS